MDPLWFASLCWWPLFSLFSGASLFFPLALFSAKYSTFYLCLFLFSFAFLSPYSSYFGVLSDLLVRGGYQLIYNRTIMVIILIDFHSSVDNIPLKIFLFKRVTQRGPTKAFSFPFFSINSSILLFFLAGKANRARQTGVSWTLQRNFISLCSVRL